MLILVATWNVVLGDELNTPRFPRGFFHSLAMHLHPLSRFVLEK